jgi:apolipoprotein N-acyltransferase
LLRKLRAPLELAFGAGIMLAASLPSVFVWTPAGLVSPWPVVVQSADLIGERGVSVLLAVLAALSVRALCELSAHGVERRSILPIAAAAALAAGMIGHGAWSMQRYADPSAESARIGLIHAAIDPRFRWQRGNWPTILAELRRQTARAEAEGVELSIWPEAAYPYPLAHGSERAPGGQRSLFAGRVSGPVLFGLIATAPSRKTEEGLRRDSYNSATLVTPDGRMQPSYDKMELLWFGETVPLSEQIPWLKRTFQRSGGLIPGAELRGLRLDRDSGEPLRMGVLNCYEDTLPGLGRRVMQTVEPNLLVNVTNDAWFVGTAEPEMHARLGAMRAIELRRDLVRAVNMGVAGWIDAAGRVRVRSAATEPGWLLVTPTLRSGAPTLYARFGDWPMWLALGLAIGWFAWRRREPPAPS